MLGSTLNDLLESFKNSTNIFFEAEHVYLKLKSLNIKKVKPVNTT